jgi:hypothetical protein
LSASAKQETDQRAAPCLPPYTALRPDVMDYQAACLARNAANAAFPERVVSDMVSKKSDWSTCLLFQATEISHRQGLGRRPRFLMATV